MSDADVNSIEKSAGQIDVGMALRQARESAGLSVADIANRIKFAPRQVEALEANDFEHLPQAAFLRGFVRSYARALQMDEKALIAALSTEPVQQEVSKTLVASVPFPTVQSLRRINVFWLAGALGVALVLALFVLFHNDEASVKPSQVVVETVSLPSPEVAVSAVADSVPPASDSTKVAESESAVELPRVEAAVPVVVPAKKAESSKTIETPPAVISTETDADEVPAVVAKPALALEVLKRRPLHFVFREDSWAEVTDVNGAILLSKINPRNSEQWIGGPRRAPYEISIAHPGSVRLYYKGKEIDLSAYASTETAHLQVE